MWCWRSGARLWAWRPFAAAFEPGTIKMRIEQWEMRATKLLAREGEQWCNDCCGHFPDPSNEPTVSDSQQPGRMKVPSLLRDLELFCQPSKGGEFSAWRGMAWGAPCSAPGPPPHVGRWVEPRLLHATLRQGVGMNGARRGGSLLSVGLLNCGSLEYIASTWGTLEEQF